MSGRVVDTQSHGKSEERHEALIILPKSHTYIVNSHISRGSSGSIVCFISLIHMEEVG